MDKSRKLGALLGFGALAIALLGVAMLFVKPASADPKPCDGDQGLMTINLGI
jgi:hypothetical protein